MKYLIAESISHSPHLETSGEIALSLLNEGANVTYAWLGNGLPWSDWSTPIYEMLVGNSLERKEHLFENLIRERGVRIYPRYSNCHEWNEKARKWAKNFSGNLSALKEYKFEDVNIGLGVASSLISVTRNSQYDPCRDRKRVCFALESALIVYLRAIHAIETIGPEAVITFNGRFATALPIVMAAKTKKLIVLRHERGSDFRRYELYSESIHDFSNTKSRIIDYWNKADERQRIINGHSFYFRRRSGDGIGWHSFVNGQIKGNVPKKKDGIFRVVYFSSSDDEYAAIQYTSEDRSSKNQIGAVKELIKIINEQKGVEFIIRIHPHMATKSIDDRRQWEELRNLGVIVIGANEKIDSYALMDSSNMIFSYGSTIGIEASYWGKPSIVLGPCAYRGFGAVYEPNNTSELRDLIERRQDIGPLPLNASLAYGNYYSTYGKKFNFFEPESLTSGKFLGVNLKFENFFITWVKNFGGRYVYDRLKNCVNKFLI